jgi:glucose 1-dehydrogenase
VSYLPGKKALVTGAGMGIGQGIALELARQGADVAVHYAHTEPEETVKEIERSGTRYTTVQGDLSKTSECEHVVEEAADFVTGQILYVDGGTTARMALWWDQGDEPQ